MMKEPSYSQPFSKMLIFTFVKTPTPSAFHLLTLLHLGLPPACTLSPSVSLLLGLSWCPYSFVLRWYPPNRANPILLLSGTASRERVSKCWWHGPRSRPSDFGESLLVTLLFTSCIFPGIVASQFSKVSISSESLPSLCLVLTSAALSFVTSLGIWKPAVSTSAQSYQTRYLLLLSACVFISLSIADPPWTVLAVTLQSLLTASRAFPVLDSAFSYPSHYILSHFKLHPN